MFVKICGITRSEDAVVALEASADAIGFVSYPPSPRYAPPEKVAAILSARLPQKKFLAVGVFVNPDIKLLKEYIDAGVNVIQLHGDESAEFALEAAELATVWKAVRPRDKTELAPFANFPADKFLVDAHHDSMPGGTGLQVAIETALAAVGILPRPVVLAGGLTPGNVAATIAAVRPAGVDVSGGVETRPGVKNHELIRRFVAEAKSPVP